MANPDANCALCGGAYRHKYTCPSLAAQASDEPMPCPFCGGAPQVDEDHDDHGNRVIECAECGASVGANMLSAGWRRWNQRVATSRATADVERVMMDCLIALSIGYVQTNEDGDEVCADCDVDHVGADHSPDCLVLRARAARAQLAATKPGETDELR